MKYVFLCLCIILVSCRSIKKVSEKQEIEDHFSYTKEVQIIEVRDTIFKYIPMPEPGFRETLSDSSYLSTSMAWSFARFKDGLLTHTIENKPEVMIRVPSIVKQEVYHKADSSIKERLILETKTVIKEKYRFLNSFFYYSGCVFWLITIILLIWKPTKLLRIFRK